jgi:hypothetical protein
MSDPYLFAATIVKCALVTGLGPAIAIAFLFEKFGTGALRPEQSESGHVLGSNPRFVSDSLSASSIISGGGQLVLPVMEAMPTASLRATSPLREVRRIA